MTEKTKRPTGATKTVVSASAPAVATAPAKSVSAVKVAKPKAAKTVATKPAKITNPAPTPEKVAPIVPTVKEVKGEKHKKPKMIRDSFTMLESDYAQIAALKERCVKAGVSAKKSEVLRAALKCLASVSDLELTKAISDLDVIKTGRPAKG